MNDKEEIREQMERIYSVVPPANIPWNILDPPELPVKAVETGKIKPCGTADLGCGAGNYGIWLAQQGFEVTGFDISENAIKYAEDIAKPFVTFTQVAFSYYRIVDAAPVRPKVVSSQPRKYLTFAMAVII